MADWSPCPKSVWNRIPQDRRDDLIEFALEHAALTAWELATAFQQQVIDLHDPTNPFVVDWIKATGA